jgi:hypothetical protein
MKLAILTLGLLSLVVQPALAADKMKTPDAVKSAIESMGARNFVNSLSSDEVDQLLDKIGTGDSAWLAIVPNLKPGVDAAASEGLTVMLGAALPLNPNGVLALLDRSFKDANILTTRDVCGVPFIEAIPRGYRPTAIAAVEDVNDPKLQRVKTRCLKQLRVQGPIRPTDWGANPPTRHPVASPKVVASGIARMGAKAFMAYLYDEERDVLRDRISMGNADWIALAPSLAPAAPPDSPDSVAIELAYALLSNPAAVLKVVAKEPESSAISVARVCSVPFGKAAPLPHRYADKAIASVDRVHIQQLQAVGQKCLDTLRVHVPRHVE